MAITIHYINKKWKLISKLINMKLFEEPHNAEYLSKVLDYIVRSFEVENII